MLDALMRKFCFIVLCFIISTFDLIFAKSVYVIELNVATDFKTLKGTEAKSPLPKPAKVVVNFALSDQQYQITSPEETLRIDFKSNRAFSIFSDEVYRERSIFSDITYRTLELANRDHIREVMSAADLKENSMNFAFSTTLSEHNFSVLADQGGSKLVRSELDDQILYKLEDEIVFSYSKEGKKIPAKVIDQFWRAYRYKYGIHPVILDELLQKTIIPDTFISQSYSSHMVNRRFDLDKIDIVKDFSFREAKGKRKFDSKELSELYDLGRTLNVEKYKAIQLQLIKQAVSLAKEEKNLEAMLRFLELSLVSGSHLPEEFDLVKDNLIANENVNLLLTHIAPNSRKSAEQAVKVLTKLEKHAGKAAYVLKIFRANITDNLGVEKEPLALMNEVIRKNPYIVGLWSDLAKKYKETFWDQDYWIGLDIAYKMNSKHSMLKEHNEYMTTILNHHKSLFSPVNK